MTSYFLYTVILMTAASAAAVYARSEARNMPDTRQDETLSADDFEIIE